jgi:hypothetical protein
VLWDFATKFIPVISVAGRLITWGSREHRFYATDQPARASQMLAAIAQAESERMGAATQ